MGKQEVLLIMMKQQNQRNYQKELEKNLAMFQKQGERPKLLLQCCCAPCSSYVLEYLMSYFHITIFFYNPNIYPQTEYDYRKEELKRLVRELSIARNWDELPLFVETTYDPERFFAMAKGMEHVPEGGERCFACYELRLREAARYAKDYEYDYFTTTLSISPLKNAEKLNQIGSMLSDEYGISYLFSDFKKKNGYKRSIELSKEFDLYRQNFCGCVFSKASSHD